MTAVKAHQANAFLKSPDAACQTFLFYGPDAGMISERASQLARVLAARENPPGEIVRLDDLDLESDPDRLSLELLTVPMFGGRKIIRATTGRRINVNLLKPLIEDGALAGTLIVEAGDLKRSDSLRTTCERSAKAAAIPCYGDEAQDLGAIVRDVMDANKLTLSPAARQLLLTRLGADRALSRGEVEKLALYALDRGTITEDDVDAVVGDASELTIDRIVNAAGTGDSSVAVHELSRALSAGDSAQMIILSLQRHFVKLHRIRTATDQGRPLETVISELKPPIHFKQKPALTAQCRAWRAEALEHALAGIAVAARTARRTSVLEDTLAERLVIALARMARPSR